MKKMIKKGFLGALLCCGILSSTAQQLPNYGFENWKSSCGSTYTTIDKGSFTRPGVEPNDWNGSNVTQSVVSNSELVVSSEGISGNAVKLTNKYVGALGVGSNAPAYITLGTPWVFADTGKMSQNAVNLGDGGTFGGVAFTARPDAITGFYKRTGDTGETAHIIVYLWNGDFYSEARSAITKSGGSFFNPTYKESATITLTDQDRAIMGKITPNSNSTGKRVAYCDREITTQISEWQQILVPITYENNDIPTKMNVVISSADYWTRGNLVEESVLEVDDVKFLYYSQLSTLSVDGVAVEGFAEGTYNYTIKDFMPTNPDVDYTVKGMDATASVTTDNVNKTITVVVTNASGADADGATSHTYTITYNEPAIINSVTPINNSTNVVPSTVVSFIPSKTLVSPVVVVRDGDGNEVSAYINESNEVIFTKDYNTTYTVTVSATNLDEYSWSFSTQTGVYEYYNGDLDVDVSALGLGHVYSCNMIELARVNNESTICDLYLRNFAFGNLNVGDIVVPGVTITDNGETISYEGAVSNLKIAEGEIDCDVNVRGSEDKNGNSSMTIDVIWYNEGRSENAKNLPIIVNFVGQKVVEGLRLNNLLITLSYEGEIIDGIEEFYVFDSETFNYLLPYGAMSDEYNLAIDYTKADADATVSVEVNHFAVKIWVEKDGKSNFYSLYDDDAYYTGVELPAEIEGNLIIEGKRSNDVATKEIAGVERVLGSVIYDMPMIDGTAHYGVGLPFEGGSKYAYTVDGSEYDITDETSRETAYALVYTEEFDTNANGETIWQHTDRFTMAYQRFDLAHMAMWGITDDEVTSLRFVSEAGAFGAPVVARAAGTGMDTPALYGMVANNGLTSVSVSELDATAGEVYIINAEGTELVKADDVNTATIQPFGMAIVYRGEAAAAPASIAIEESSIATGIEGVTAGDMRVYAAEGNIYVKGYTGEVAIFTINGAQVCTVDVADNATIAMAQGMYIVRTGAQATMVVVK